MASFPGFYLTYLGRDLQAKAQAGANLVYTKMTVGDGALAEGQGFEELTGLINPILDLGIDSVVAVGDGTARIKAILSNQGVTTGFLIREIGIFADDPDTGEILYAYTNADTDTTADYLPAAGGATVTEINIEAVVSVGNATNISINISSDNFATKKDLANYTLLSDYNDHINDKNNPHDVKTITGNAGTATKLATARTIAISGGATGTATSFDGSTDITIPVTGLDMSKATSGTLSVARGGTGATTLTGLVKGNGTGAFTAATAGVDYSAVDHTHAHLTGFPESRSIETIPNDYNSSLRPLLKQNSVIGSPDASTYSSVLGFRAWVDSTGGNAHEIAFTGNGNLFHRNGATTTWNAWKQLATTDQLISANITDATSANTANMIVKRDASGNFSAGTITAALSGNAATSTKIGSILATKPATDLPSAWEGGMYYTRVYNNGYPIAYGHLLTTKYGSEATQLLLSWSENSIYFRRKRDVGEDEFSDWTKIAMTDSPAFTGTPTVPTAAVGTNTTQAASTAFVQTAITPANLGFTSWGDATAGGRKYPDGHIEQWVTVTGSGTITVTWPIAFPNACYGAVYAVGQTGNNNNSGIGSVTVTGAQITYAGGTNYIFAYGN